MPRVVKPHRSGADVPTVKRNFQIRLDLDSELDKRFRDPSNSYGTKYGGKSALINDLLAAHFLANPIVRLSEMQEIVTNAKR